MRPADSINAVVIGLLSSFGSAILIAFLFIVVYVLRYTAPGRILLDRIGRPGEFDDEQAFAREEAEALESMDDMQRTEYLRAKGSIPRSLRFVSTAPFHRPAPPPRTLWSHWCWGIAG